MLPLNTNIREAYSRGQDAEQNFIQNLAMFLCTYLKEHGSLIEQRHIDETLLKVVLVDPCSCFLLIMLIFRLFTTLY